MRRDSGGGYDRIEVEVRWEMDECYKKKIGLGGAKEAYGPKRERGMQCRDLGHGYKKERENGRRG